MEGRLQIFSGNANRPLAQEIAGYLNINLGRAIVSQFKNGESRIKLEENVRGSDVFVIQPTCTPVNEHLMELLLLIDALRRASAARVTAVIPYYGYAKQEKKTPGREPISDKLVAHLSRFAGCGRRGARKQLPRADRRRAGDHRQAAPAARCGRGAGDGRRGGWAHS